MKVVLSAKEDARGLRSVMVARSELSVWVSGAAHPMEFVTLWARLTRLSAQVDPPAIFRTLFPRQLMESTGNAVLKTSLALLQSTFLQGLAKDYDKWAVNAAYRKAREVGKS